MTRVCIRAKINHKQAGFTLIELAVVLIIAGVMMAMFGTALFKFFDQVKKRDTLNRLEVVHTTIQQYLETNGHYPCPAPTGLTGTQAKFGRSEAPVVIAGADVQHCDTATVIPGIIYADSARNYTPPGQVDADGPGPGSPSANDYQLSVRVGDVPVRTLNLPDEYIADGWGGRFSYAVTAQLTNPYRYFADGGGISVVDSGGTSVVQPPDTAQYVVLSHGSDSRGATSASDGQIMAACSGISLDALNCDELAVPANANVFRKTMLGSKQVNPLTMQPTANYFDDLMVIGFQTMPVMLMPPGAVMAFQLTSCPFGWTAFAPAQESIIVGVDPANPDYAYDPVSFSSGGNRLIAFNAPSFSSSANPDNVSSHVHTYEGEEKSIAVASGANVLNYLTNAGATASTSFGGILNVENRQPYIALLYCRKD